MSKPLSFILIGFLFFGLVQTAPLYSQEHQKLEYDVGVTARIVPVFAVDKKGNPVYDIKKGEIVFYVNGKPAPFQFQRYTFEERREINLAQPAAPELKKKPAKTGRRAIFIVIDSTFNSTEGLRRSRKITEQLFQNKFPGDDFILLENTPGGGLKYIIGPENDKNKLTAALKEFNTIPEKFPWHLYAPTQKDYTKAGSVDLSKTGFGPTFNNRAGARYRYKNFARRFTRSLRALKYALKTISKPKIVFLISEGIQRGAIVSAEFNGLLLRNLKTVAKSVNEGGSILYAVNPRKIDCENLRSDSISGEESMNFMARESGGKYFEGSDPVVVAKKIKKTTAAYYELAFTITPQMGNTQKLKLKCTRPGVRIHSIKQLSAEKPYPGMTPVEKKLFALNVANQGAWSRMVAKNRQVSYKMIEPEKKGNKTMFSIRVPIPAHLKNKKVDIFMIRTGKGKDNIDFGLNRKTAGDTEILTFEKKKNRKHYFVIIEPTTPYCIYNQVKQ
jgi:VWFA-related protein